MKNVTIGNLDKVLGLIKISSPYIDFYCQQHSKIFTISGSTLKTIIIILRYLSIGLIATLAVQPAV